MPLYTCHVKHVFLGRDGSLRASDPGGMARERLLPSPEIDQVDKMPVQRRLKKLSFHGSPVAAISANDFRELPVLPRDAEHAGDLAWQHNDPFDRMLVAQASRLGFTLVTTDAAIRAWPHVAQVWAG